MSLPLLVGFGIFVALIGSLPLVVMLERALAGKPTPHPAVIGVAILIPLALMCVSMLLVRHAYSSMLLEYALAMIGTVIIVWVIEGIRAWLAAQRDNPKEGM